jgi:restriction endonuclease S subunit
MIARVARPNPTAKGKFGKIIAHQGNIGGFKRNICACAAHRNTHGCICQRGRVVHAIADHRNLTIFFYQLADDRQFIFGHEVGAKFGETDFTWQWQKQNACYRLSA